MRFLSLQWRFVSVCVLLILAVTCASRNRPMYMNQFAVQISKGGDAHANAIADKHGFKNLGQIGSLKNFYLFEHKRLRKRSLEASSEHHENLSNEKQVVWVMQQHEKKRLKRDFTDGGFPTWEFSHLQPNSYRGASFFPDPLFKEQWYLNGGAKDGYDMNIGPAWEKGYTGKGVVVSILDDGIQTNHPDLALNYDRNASTDINDNDDDPMPRDNGDNKHGTRCAGEVAGVAFNHFCGVGVAYNASIGGVRMLDGTVNDAVEARALGLNINHIDIYSASWGPEDDGKMVDGPGPLARRAFIYGVTSGRRGKGSIFVWASGNGGRHSDSCNCDGYTNSIFTLSISSATQGGYKPWYLEECSSTLATTYSSGTPGHDKSIATVDMDGKLRPDHICTVEHTGTSASAPLAAGMCALALEANPNLTWRDMQYIVVLTSKFEPLKKEGGWTLNGVKRQVSHKFGYGLMDGGAIVSLAEQWITVPPQHICKSQEINEDRAIDPTYGSSMDVHMDVNACSGTLNEVQFVEHVQCKISLRFFPRGNLRILLTSPMGTQSTLLFERPRDIVSSNFDDWPFLSVHYWGEKAEGRWTLRIINGGSRRVNQPGILKKWQLIFYGTAVNPIRLRNSYNSYTQQSQQARGFTFPSASSPPNYFASAPSSDFFRNIDIFTGAGSEPEASVASLTGERATGGAADNHQLAPSEGRRVIHNCDPECDPQGCFGKGPTQCVACSHYKLDNTCVSRCPPRSFASENGRCYPCHESCETCAGPGQDSCLTCAPAHLRLVDLAVCLQQCPEGYYENTEEGTCVPCEANCGSCQDSPAFCTTCDHHLVLYKNKCYAACPAYTYETDDYRCSACHNSCESCSGPQENQCIACRAGYYALNGKCFKACPDGYYSNKKRRECMRCPPGCATCNTAGCLTCLADFELNKKNKCVRSGGLQCKIGNYWNGSDCLKCHVSCETCYGGDEEECLSCHEPTFLEWSRCVPACSVGYYNDHAACVPCVHTCQECISRANCTICQPPLLLQSGECRPTCAAGYYSDIGTCSKCYLSCMTCSGPRRDQCVSCPNGWQLVAGECFPECPQGYYMSDYGCQKCHHYCRTCKGEGPLQCTSCPPRAMLDGGLCITCLSSQYFDPVTQLCKSCHPSCKTCSGPGPFSCSSCTFPLHLDLQNKQCVPCCTQNTRHDCCACDEETGKCHMSSPAGKRRTAFNPEESELSVKQSLPTVLSQTTTIALLACLTAIVLFVVVFTILQRRSRGARPSYAGYEKVPIHQYTELSTSARVST